jgi:hypothetical protein
MPNAKSAAIAPWETLFRAEMEPPPGTRPGSAPEHAAAPVGA